MLFKPLLPLVEYAVNYDYISKVLCVNKETPIMGCDGKCYLMSQLAANSETDKPITDKKITVKQIEVLFLQEIKAVVFEKVIISQRTILNTSYTNLYNYLHCGSSFHPPSDIS